jgi:hypothetical protein
MTVRADDVTFLDLFEKLGATAVLHKVGDIRHLLFPIQMIEVHDVRRETSLTVLTRNPLHLVDELPEPLSESSVPGLLTSRICVTMFFLDLHHARLAT